MERRTVIDRIEAALNGNVGVRFKLLIEKDGKELRGKPVRMMIHPGEDASKKVALIGANMEMLYGVPPLNQERIGLLLDVCKMVQTEAATKRYLTDSFERADRIINPDKHPRLPIKSVEPYAVVDLIGIARDDFVLVRIDLMTDVGEIITKNGVIPPGALLEDFFALINGMSAAIDSGPLNDDSVALIRGICALAHTEEAIARHTECVRKQAEGIRLAEEERERLKVQQAKLDEARAAMAPMRAHLHEIARQRMIGRKLPSTGDQ